MADDQPMAKPPRHDVAALMLARRQIDRASFKAARAYQSGSAVSVRRIETRIARQFGGEGLQLVRDVLASGASIERAARARGDDDRPGQFFWGAFFRHCLRALAAGLPA
jgi:hypothetical protein